MSTTLKINGKSTSIDADPSMPLLWTIRDEVGLSGTKFGCGVSLCGACTVHLNGKAVRSCVTPLAAAEGADVTTIEGLTGREGLALQAAWQEMDVAQCGYCQSGQLMQAAVLLAANPAPTDSDIDAAMSGNACRCATYYRIRAAIHRAAATLRG